jgi:hypothetical protein
MLNVFKVEQTSLHWSANLLWVQTTLWNIFNLNVTYAVVVLKMLVEYIEEFGWLNLYRRTVWLHADSGGYSVLREDYLSKSQSKQHDNMTSGNSELTHTISFYVILCFALLNHYITLCTFFRRLRKSVFISWQWMHQRRISISLNPRFYNFLFLLQVLSKLQQSSAVVLCI